MGVIKVRMKQKSSENDINTIWIETGSNLVLRQNGENIETSISNIENTIGNIEDALERILSGDDNV